MKSFRDRVADYMKQTGQAKTEKHVLIGVSGGVDSVVLLDVFDRLGFECEVIHVNFQLRGSESDRDEKFVVDLCAQRGFKLHVHQAPVEPDTAGNKRSVQMIAREIRYSLFAKTASKQQIASVAVGHHCDDQAESLLINLNRGTGLEGIAGMRPVRSLDASCNLIRPLLAETRESIRAYAEARHLEWREDTSNQDEKYLRSRLRAKVMPHLNAEALARSCNLVGQWVDQCIVPAITENFDEASHGQSLKISYLEKLPSILAQRLVIEALRRWIPRASADEAIAQRIIALIPMQSGKRIEVGGGVVWRDRNDLTFSAFMEHEKMKRFRLFGNSSPIPIPGGKLRLDLTPTKPRRFTDSDEAWLDADQLTIPLTVRTWEEGDRIRPLGMKGTKKISDLITDIGISASKRKDTIVVCSEQEIVWVVGYRLSDTFRITDKTRNYVRLYFERD